MSGTIERIEVRNSDLHIRKDKRAFLTYPSDGLVLCELEELEDGIAFLFETAGLASSPIVWDMPRDEKLRFLLNVADLMPLSAEYFFSLAPENIMIDRNLRPQILLRDVQQKEDAFLERYKALIGALFLRKYHYEDFLNGGADLCKKHKLLRELSPLKTVDEIRERLLEEYTKELEMVKECKCVVSKRKRLAARIAVPLLAVLLAGATALSVWAMFFTIPHQDALLAANTSYIAGDPLHVQWHLRNIPVEQLNDETKYFLSRSYVATEALTDAQRQNVLMGLTQLTDPHIFEYWIHLGRLELDEALDLARRFNDNEMMLFAYIKLEAVVRADTVMPGDEKIALLDQIERQINNLQQAREEAQAAETP